jgi:hypothetical protein
MMIRPGVDPRLCFVLMPFTKTFDQYYKTILKPSVESKGFQCVRADGIYGQAIMTDIWNSIWRAAVVIADVTRKNPNVNYELGICHALGVPTVIITQSRRSVPFDYRYRRHILYQPKTIGWKKRLDRDLSNHIDAALDHSNRDRLLVWPDGAKIAFRRTAKGHLQNPRSVLLDFPRVPFTQGQRADFILEELTSRSKGFDLKITLPQETYWRAGFALAPEDYIHEGRSDITITQYFLFHIGQGGHANPKQPTPLNYIAYHEGRSAGAASFQSGSPIELAVRFIKDRRLRVDFGNRHYEAELDQTYFRYLYILAWADQFGPFRIPVELTLH